MEVLAILFFWAGNLADWYTTKRLVIDRRTGKELNPLIAKLIDRMGTEPFCCGMVKAEAALLAVKVILGLILHLIAAPAYLFWILGSMFAAAAISNKWNLLGKLINKIKSLRS